MGTSKSRRGTLDIVPGTLALPAGGGPFALDHLTIGVFHDAQPKHRLKMGSDREVERPLGAEEGWVLPAGASGLCLFDDPLKVTMVTVPTTLLAEVELSDPQSLAPRIGALDPLVARMITDALPARDAPLLYRETMARAFAAHLAHTLKPAPIAAAATADTRLTRAIDYIRDNLAEDLSLETMAGIAGMSPFHFARVFKATTGESPLQYVIARRLELAGLLLKTTDLAVVEIAYRVGYEDVSRFGEHFKRRMGATPAVYRAG